jgi:cyclopropane-fatty-acyl-phospholipid synthase
MLKLETFVSRARDLGFPIAIEMPDGKLVSAGEPALRIRLRNDAGARALASLDELPISEAYIRGDLELEGDLVGALTRLRDGLSDQQLAIKVWRRVQPWFAGGREKLNPEWIAKHYDSGNIQFHAQDRDYRTYTPGLYESDDDSMEVGAERKLAFAFDNLRLAAGQRLLEVGCGWGGMTRYSCRRGVKVTGITLSRDQLAYTRERVREEQLDADIRYQDFFTYEPDTCFHAISMMGVIEDLSDYPRVIERISRWLVPGGRVYLDFAAAVEPVATSSFVTKYVWPGTFRMVYMPELVSAVTHSPFEIAAIWNDRRNYHLWAKKGHERWVEERDEIIASSSPETWRLMRILFAGTAGVMDSPIHDVTAFRVLLELPADTRRRVQPMLPLQRVQQAASDFRMRARAQLG